MVICPIKNQFNNIVYKDIGDNKCIGNIKFFLRIFNDIFENFWCINTYLIQHIFNAYKSEP